MGERSPPMRAGQIGPMAAGRWLSGEMTGHDGWPDDNGLAAMDGLPKGDAMNGKPLLTGYGLVKMALRMPKPNNRIGMTRQAIRLYVRAENRASGSERLCTETRKAIAYMSKGR